MKTVRFVFEISTRELKTLTVHLAGDDDVRLDMTDSLDKLAPEDKSHKGIYRHDAEGSDDMPAHIKSSLVGASVSVPISNGKLATGTWQGIWFMEFRNMKQRRKVMATIQGEKI